MCQYTIQLHNSQNKNYDVVKSSMAGDDSGYISKLNVYSRLHQPNGISGTDGGPPSAIAQRQKSQNSGQGEVYTHVHAQSSFLERKPIGLRVDDFACECSRTQFVRLARFSRIMMYYHK